VQRRDRSLDDVRPATLEREGAVSTSNGLNKRHKRQRTALGRYRIQEVAGSSPASSSKRRKLITRRSSVSTNACISVRSGATTLPAVSIRPSFRLETAQDLVELVVSGARENQDWPTELAENACSCLLSELVVLRTVQVVRIAPTRPDSHW
jgi:hypothetical protein